MMTLETGKGVVRPAQLQNTSGFTMVELLVTISLIVFLMSMLAVGAGRYLENTSAKATEAQIARIQLYVQEYKSLLGSYPPDGLDGIDVTTEEGTPLTGGSALSHALLNPMLLTMRLPNGEIRVTGEQPPIGEFRSDELYVTEEDSEALEIVDSWRNPLHYDNVQRGDKSFSPQSFGETHLDWDDDMFTHMEDSREIEEISGVVGPQNLGEYDIWSHGSSGHESDEAYSDYISNWELRN
ncbi:MAG: type II secretion system protein [Planctomycetia bacterium]|nr:type II secretion system protein [Planctomycetia bacterium]MBL6914470.1 type II secretion system protein [Planctomycetota bacterium]HCW43726.1 hypothetical protein [Planctomycetota bacterium]